MKLHSSGSSLNGSAVNDEPYEPDDETQEEDEQLEYDYAALFDAPNYSDFIKTPPNSKARVYEKRVQSMVKAGMVMSLNNQQWPDAATFLKHGPGFAKAAGNLAAEDARAAQIVDMLTAPDSPYVMFAMVAIPMIAQLVRNHEPQINEVADTWRNRRRERKQAKLSGQSPRTVKVNPPITVRLFKREFTLPIRFRLRFKLNIRKTISAFTGATQHPGHIASEVFSDPAVIKALHKMGIYPQASPAVPSDES